MPAHLQALISIQTSHGGRYRKRDGRQVDCSKTRRESRGETHKDKDKEGSVT